MKKKEKKINKQKKQRQEKQEPLSKVLYMILACPTCKSSVRYNKTKTALICIKCKATYPIKQGIPIMLPKHH